MFPTKAEHRYGCSRIEYVNLDKLSFVYSVLLYALAVPVTKVMQLKLVYPLFLQ